MWSADAEAQAATVLFLGREPNRTEHRSIAAFLKPRSVLRRQDRSSVFFLISGQLPQLLQGVSMYIRFDQKVLLFKVYQNPKARIFFELEKLYA